MGMKTPRRSLLIALLTAGTYAPAYAQDRTQTEQDEAVSGLEDIIVTATRREERLEDVPVAVTAITAAAIQGAGLTDTRNLTQVVPGFFGGRAAGAFFPVIRGVGSNGISVGDESNVASYVDGIYQGDSISTWTDLVEVERVEVLRGPQGTVFGRNATGGLINVITPDPSFTPRGKVAGRLAKLAVGDALEHDLRAYVTGPLGSTVAADFAGVYRKTGAYVKDLVREGKEGEVRVINLRSKLLFAPTDRIRLLLAAEYMDQNSSTNPFQPYKNNTAGRRFPGVIVPSKPWQFSTDVEPKVDLEHSGVSLRTRFEFQGFNLETTSAYLDNTLIQVGDTDSSNIPLATFEVPGQNSKNFSQEVRLLSTGGGPLKWILGAYAFDLNGKSDFKLGSSAGPPAPLVISHFQPRLTTRSYAGFAEGTYSLTDELFLTVGARYTWEKRTFDQKVNGVKTFLRPAKTSFDKVTYRAALRYQISDESNIYASYGTGFKSGVFNMTGTSPLATDPETITSYEAGLKADPLPWLRTNISLFYYDYEDLQVSARAVSGPGYVLQNAASAELYGGELEVMAAATEELDLRGSVAYNHAEYANFPAAQTFVPRPDGGNTVQPGDVSGNNMIRAPRWTFNLGFNWGREFIGGHLNLNSNLFYSSRVYFDFANLTSQKPYTLVSGELSWTTSDAAWRFSIWTTNVTNSKVFREIRTAALATDFALEAPRRVGIGLERRF